MGRTRTRRRQYPLGWAPRALLVTGAIVPSALGSAAIAAMTFWALPTGSALGEQHVLTLNVLTAVVYGAIAVPAGTIWGLIWLTIPEGADPAVVLRRTLLAAPSRMATI
jgi:adenylate cyclase